MGLDSITCVRLWITAAEMYGHDSYLWVPIPVSQLLDRPT